MTPASRAFEERSFEELVAEAAAVSVDGWDFATTTRFLIEAVEPV
ncbi:hypothetical protein OG883_04055 [Streptomyces sp. NBC_01142]|nr:hypothetical protein [Streptomyces sp. NBC_01142]MCX4819090.1 hypothetical protein [Streptomyces sp. NBC_01142]